MRRKPVQIYAIWRYRRIYDHRRGHWRWKRSESKPCRKRRDKTDPLKAKRTQLLAGIEENASTATYHCFPVRRIAEDVCGPEPGRKIEPSGLPKWRALRCQRYSIRVRSLESVGL